MLDMGIFALTGYGLAFACLSLNITLVGLAYLIHYKHIMMMMTIIIFHVGTMRTSCMSGNRFVFR